jgi:hypothetical protein
MGVSLPALLLAALPALAASTPAAPPDLAALLAVSSAPVDQAALDAPPPAGASPKENGERLAGLQARLERTTLALESFRDPRESAAALAAAAPHLDPGLRPFFKSRDTALDALYRTLALTDFTWALRFPSPPCSPREKRAALLRSGDGLFADASGTISPWLAALLGPGSAGKSAEAALDRASAALGPDAAGYERLRARARLITEALASERAVGAVRAKLYCERASVYEDLAAAHRSSAAPLAAGRKTEGADPATSVLILGARDGSSYDLFGAGVLVRGPHGTRVLTDAGLVRGRKDLVAFVPGTKSPRALTVESTDASGIALARLPDADGLPALTLAANAPAPDDLVTAVGHARATGFWSKTQGLVTATGDGCFRADALLAPGLRGAAVLDQAGDLAGVSVLRPGGSRPEAVSAARLKSILSGAAGPWTASAPLSEDGAGTASLITAAAPIGVPGGLIETGQYRNVSSDGNTGEYCTDVVGCVPYRCVENCGGASDDSSSSGSNFSAESSYTPTPSYSSNVNVDWGAQMGTAMAQAMAPMIQQGATALLRWLVSPSTYHHRTYHRAYHPRPNSVATTNQTPIQPPPPPPPPKDPKKPTKVTLAVVPTAAAIGTPITLVAQVEFTGKDPADKPYTLTISAVGANSKLINFSKSTTFTLSDSGRVTIDATLVGDLQSRADSAQEELDREVRQHEDGVEQPPDSAVEASPSRARPQATPQTAAERHAASAFGALDQETESSQEYAQSAPPAEPPASAPAQNDSGPTNTAAAVMVNPSEIVKSPPGSSNLQPWPDRLPVNTPSAPKRKIDFEATIPGVPTAKAGLMAVTCPLDSVAVPSSAHPPEGMPGQIGSANPVDVARLDFCKTLENDAEVACTERNEACRGDWLRNHGYFRLNCKKDGSAISSLPGGRAGKNPSPNYVCIPTHANSAEGIKPPGNDLHLFSKDSDESSSSEHATSGKSGSGVSLDPELKRELEAEANRPDPSDKGGRFTKAGRNLAKHMVRPGTRLKRSNGSPEQFNKRAESLVKNILDNPISLKYRSSGRWGRVMDIRGPSGEGLCFTLSGNFIYFLEKEK